MHHAYARAFKTLAIEPINITQFIAVYIIYIIRFGFSIKSLKGEEYIFLYFFYKLFILYNFIIYLIYTYNFIYIYKIIYFTYVYVVSYSTTRPILPTIITVS